MDNLPRRNPLTYYCEPFAGGAAVLFARSKVEAENLAAKVDVAIRAGEVKLAHRRARARLTPYAIPHTGCDCDLCEQGKRTYAPPPMSLTITEPEIKPADNSSWRTGRPWWGT